MSFIPDGQEHADCQDCGLEMKKGGGCTTGMLELNNGRLVDRVRNNIEDPCHDCNAGLGMFHHIGCDMERCPGCGNQLLGCGCDMWKFEEEI